MSASLGRNYAVSYSLSTDRTTVPTDFAILGSLRNKSFGPSWETVDVTTDTSRDQTRENLATFKEFNPSLSGLVDDDESNGYDTLEDYIINPPSGQPKGWLKFERPTKNNQIKAYAIPVLFTGTPINANFDSPAEFALDALSDGAVQTTYT